MWHQRNTVLGAPDQGRCGGAIDRGAPWRDLRARSAGQGFSQSYRVRLVSAGSIAARDGAPPIVEPRLALVIRTSGPQEAFSNDSAYPQVAIGSLRLVDPTVIAHLLWLRSRMRPRAHWSR